MLDEEELGALEEGRGPLGLEVVEDWIHEGALLALLRGQVNVNTKLTVYHFLQTFLTLGAVS